MLEKPLKKYKYVGAEHIKLSVINSPVGDRIKTKKPFNLLKISLRL